MDGERDRPDEVVSSADVNPTIPVTEPMAKAGALALSTFGIDSESLEEGATRIYLEMANAKIVGD